MRRGETITESGSKEKEIHRKIEDFGRLIDEQTAKLLLEYERGQLSAERTEKMRTRLEKLTNSTEEALILEVDPIKTYRKRGGTEGRYLGIKVALAGGREAKIVFWDKQIEEVNQKEAKSGTKVSMINCMQSDGKYGLTITTGKGGTIRVGEDLLLYPAVKK